jgi:hypothetical protein
VELPKGVYFEARVKKCALAQCNGKCGDFHDVKKAAKKVVKAAEKAPDVCAYCKKVDHKFADCPKIAAKEKAAAEKKALLVPTPTTTSEEKSYEKKEGLVNGPRFDSTTAAKSVGVSQVTTAGSQLVRMCATMALNGIITCLHIFDQGGDKITFGFGADVEEVSRSNGKVIGRDLLWFPRPAKFSAVPMLRASKPNVGEKIELVTFDSVEDCASGRYKHDAGLVKSLLTDKVGDERGYASYSSVSGNCGSPILNTNGKVVGFHTATTSVDTVFSPITAHVVHSATGSTPSF